MDARTFGWSVLASLCAAFAWALLPGVARTLARLRARLLGSGPDADRLQEEWLAVLDEATSRREQFRFALSLFADFRTLQLEIEFRANEAADIEALVERRVQERLDLLLLARERAHEPQPETDTEEAYEFGQFRLYSEDGALTRSGIRTPLTPKATDVLVELVRNSGRVVTKRQLLDAVWGSVCVEESSVAFQIHVVRRTLGRRQDGSAWIETIPRRGYRFGPAAKGQRPRRIHPGVNS